MKTVDFKKKFKDYKGTETVSIIEEELSKVLFNAGIQGIPIKDEDKYRAYKLSTKLIAHSGVIELGDDDVAFLKTFCSAAFAAGAYGQIVELLEK